MPLKILKPALTCCQDKKLVYAQYYYRKTFVCVKYWKNGTNQHIFLTENNLTSFHYLSTDTQSKRFISTLASQMLKLDQTFVQKFVNENK